MWGTNDYISKRWRLLMQFRHYSDERWWFKNSAVASSLSAQPSSRLCACEFKLSVTKVAFSFNLDPPFKRFPEIDRCGWRNWQPHADFLLTITQRLCCPSLTTAKPVGTKLKRRHRYSYGFCKTGSILEECWCTYRLAQNWHLPNSTFW